MHLIRFVVPLGVGLASAGPALALSPIAEHEPARGALLLGLIFVVALAWVMACRRWWLPLLAWVPLSLAASAFVSHLIDPTVSAVIRDEIGLDYLMETDLFVAVAVVAPLMFANARLARKESARSNEAWREWFRR